MKKIIFLLLLITSVSYGQAIAPTRVKITNNAISTTAPFIATQETDGFVNKINKFDLIEVIEYASAVNLPVTGVAGKIYVTKDNGKIYRWNDTYYAELSAQNNIVRTLKILTTSLSGVGRIEQQICDYILALPAEQRTIAETDSKWNVVITEHSLYNIDLTSSNWGGITTASAWESQFLSIDGSIANVSNFTLENGRVRFNVETDVLELDLSNQDITDVGVIDIGGLLYLGLSDNQLTSFDPSIALPSGLLELDLSSNQLTTISYTNAEAWANAQPAFTNPCNVYFRNNINSITGTNLESILLTKNCIINH